MPETQQLAATGHSDFCDGLCGEDVRIGGGEERHCCVLEVQDRGDLPTPSPAAFLETQPMLNQ